MQKDTWFERALFLSWYCSKGDCAFCYMSTQKPLIKDPKKARRSMASVFAEALICRACNWEIEFLSGGYDSFTIEELAFISKTISKITGKKQWLNIGTLSQAELRKLKPYAEGYVGTLECVNEKLRKKICPSKPLDEIAQTFEHCNCLGLKKAVTVIIGLGESLDDFEYLAQFILTHDISRITYYSLNPQKGTIFKKSPGLDYYSEWINMTRKRFPYIHITAGAWHDKVDYYARLLTAGADNFTKFPAIRFFGTPTAGKLADSINDSKRNLVSNFDIIPEIEIPEFFRDDLRQQVSIKLQKYLKKMKKATA